MGELEGVNVGLGEGVVGKIEVGVGVGFRLGDVSENVVGFMSG